LVIKKKYIFFLLGCFLIEIYKSKTTKLGETVKLTFSISQHSRDEQLMKGLISYFGCGRYVSPKDKDIGGFRVTKIKDINEKIIPFFKKYPIIGVKGLRRGAERFSDFCIVAKLMKNMAHLTPKGLEKIRRVVLQPGSKRE